MRLHDAVLGYVATDVRGFVVSAVDCDVPTGEQSRVGGNAMIGAAGSRSE